MSMTGMQQSVRYLGALLCRQRCTTERVLTQDLSDTKRAAFQNVMRLEWDRIELTGLLNSSEFLAPKMGHLLRDVSDPRTLWMRRQIFLRLSLYRYDPVDLSVPF